MGTSPLGKTISPVENPLEGKIIRPVKGQSFFFAPHALPALGDSSS